MITLRDIIDEVQLATRAGLRDELSEANFANRVGRRWSHMHRWRYLDGKSYLFFTVVDQIEYVLPADLGELEIIYGEQDTFTSWEVVSIVSWTDWHSAVRRDIGTFAGRFYGALNYETVTVDSVEQVRPVLSLTPKPTFARELRVVYRRSWTPVVSTDDVVNIPPFAEEAFLELVRMMALAFNAPTTDGNPDPMGAMIANFRAGATFDDAKRADGMTQPRINRAAGAIEDALAHSADSGTFYPRSTTQDLLAGL